MTDTVGVELDGCEAVLLISSLFEEKKRLIAELREARREIETLNARLSEACAPMPASVTKVEYLPILCRDLARWSTPVEFDLEEEIILPIGPPPLPPLTEDIESFVQVIAILRRLLHIAPQSGKPLHTAFDPARLQSFQSKHREALLLAEKFFGQVERSKIQKNLSLHLLLAKKSDEMTRQRR